MRRKLLVLSFLLIFTASVSAFANDDTVSNAEGTLTQYSDTQSESGAETEAGTNESRQFHSSEYKENIPGDFTFYTPADYSRWSYNGNLMVHFATPDVWSNAYTIPIIEIYKYENNQYKYIEAFKGDVASETQLTVYKDPIKLSSDKYKTGAYRIVVYLAAGYSNGTPYDEWYDDEDLPVFERTFYIVPSGKVTIKNTIANSAKKTNDVIWDKSNVRAATNYQISWRAKGGKWAYRNVGNTTRGTTSGLTVGNLYEIRVRPYAKSSSWYGSWSNTVYRYFHTTERIRLSSKSKGSFTISWKRNSKATSYQIMFSTNPSGKGAANNINTVGASATSFTKKGLKSGKTYYVQIREIRRYAGKNWIGNISRPVKVRIK